MRKVLVVPLVLAAVAAAGPALGQKSDRRVRPISAVATPTVSLQSATSASVLVKAPAATRQARKSKTPVVTAAAPTSNVVAGCDGSLGIFGTTASACAGFFTGNLLNGSPQDLAAQDSALAQLGFDFSGDLSSYLKIDTSDATFLDFGQDLIGKTIIGIHFGNGSGVGNSTGFFEFDFASAVDGISLNIPGSSGVVLYQTGTPSPGPIPEPGTWAMMLLGFGLVGAGIRRRGKASLIPQIA